MDQYLFLNFAIAKNNKSFQLLIQPGCPFEEVQEVLSQYKADFEQLQKDQLAKAEEEKAKAAAQAAPVEPEVVQN